MRFVFPAVSKKRVLLSIVERENSRSTQQMTVDAQLSVTGNPMKQILGRLGWFSQLYLRILPLSRAFFPPCLPLWYLPEKYNEARVKLFSLLSSVEHPNLQNRRLFEDIFCWIIICALFVRRQLKLTLTIADVL